MPEKDKVNEVIRMTEKHLYSVLIIGLLTMAMLTAGCISSKSSAADAKSTITDMLAGTNLTYYSIAGQPMNYTISRDDIGTVEPTTYEGKDAWKVRVGQGLAWDLTMDASGKEILYVDQLFRT
jgi:hypothetical protein